MEHNRKQKLLMIIALVAGIASLSIGFAAFSATLNISSSASVTPNNADFSVKFSILSAIVQTGEVVPEKSVASLIATDGIIDNSATPTIKNLSVTFTEPGQYVDYWFFIVNSGKYNAFLNSVNFLGDKICVGANNATDSLVQAACDSINISVTIGDNEYFESTAVSDMMLSTNKSENIRVRLSYDANGNYVDGNFSVIFPNVALVYSTIDDSMIAPTVESRIPQVVSGNLDIPGSIVSIGNEKFYVINRGSGNVRLLSMYNLNVGNIKYDANSDAVAISNPTGIQDDDALGYRFDESNPLGIYPWVGVTQYSNHYAGSSYSGSVVEGYVNNYATYLRNFGANIAIARLATVDDLNSVGCYSDGLTCTGAPDWVYSTAYWTMSAVDSGAVWRVECSGYFDAAGVTMNDAFGVRPVIEIPISEF